jgi:hypothetical protein
MNQFKIATVYLDTWSDQGEYAFIRLTNTCGIRSELIEESNDLYYTLAVL